MALRAKIVALDSGIKPSFHHEANNSTDNWTIIYDDKGGTCVKRGHKENDATDPQFNNEYTSNEYTSYVFDAPPSGSANPDGIIDAIIRMPKSEIEKEIDKKLIQWGFGNRQKQALLDMGTQLEDVAVLIRIDDNNIQDIDLPAGKTENSTPIELQGTGDIIIDRMIKDFQHLRQEMLEVSPNLKSTPASGQEIEHIQP